MYNYNIRTTYAQHTLKVGITIIYNACLRYIKRIIKHQKYQRVAFIV